jgi:hypothetical protein
MSYEEEDTCMVVCAPLHKVRDLYVCICMYIRMYRIYGKYIYKKQIYIYIYALGNLLTSH